MMGDIKIVGMENGKSGHEHPLSAPSADSGTLIISSYHGKADAMRVPHPASPDAPPAKGGHVPGP